MTETLRSRGAVETPAAAPAPALDVSLTCLTHPSSVAAIVLLLGNDHLLKGAAPGWLTGKLSDFVGLYFFPFLLAALSVPLCHRLPARVMGRAAFAVTGLWFAAVKLSAQGHALTLALVEGVLGPVSIARDPSDAWALLSLAPAWLLWRSAERADAVRRERTRLAVVCVAALACIATPATRHEPNAAIVAVEARGAELIATQTTLGWRAGPDSCERHWARDPFSTWHPLPSCQWRPPGSARLAEVRLEPAGAAVEPHPPAELVHPDDAGYRVRVTPQGAALFEPYEWPTAAAHPTVRHLTSIGIDYSLAGEPWRRGFRVPEAAAVYHAATYRAKSPYEDFRVFDMTWTPGGRELALAMGTQGILIGRDERWRRVAVGRVAPALPWSTWHARWLLVARTWPLGVAGFWVTLGVLGPIAWRQGRRRGERPRLPLRVALARIVAWWTTFLGVGAVSLVFGALGAERWVLGWLSLPILVLWSANHFVRRRDRTRSERLAVLLGVGAGVCAMLAAGSVTYAWPLPVRGSGHTPLPRYEVAALAPLALALALQLWFGRYRPSSVKPG